MITTENGVIVNKVIDKIYVIKAKRRRSNGEEYIYKNFEVFIPYELINVVGIDDHMYVYEKNNEIYLTSAEPDASVPMKRLSVHKQRGNRISRKFKPEETRNNKWKRFFIVPKTFFPYVSEDKQVEFILDSTRKDPFSNVGAVLKMRITDKE